MSIRSRTDARRLDQRVTIQRPTETRDPATGESFVGWEDMATVWAAVDGQKAGERYAGGATTDVEGYNVWIRWRPNVTAGCRVVWGERVLEVISVPDQQRRGRLLALFCNQGTTEG